MLHKNKSFNYNPKFTPMYIATVFEKVDLKSWQRSKWDRQVQFVCSGQLPNPNNTCFISVLNIFIQHWSKNSFIVLCHAVLATFQLLYLMATMWWREPKHQQKTSPTFTLSTAHFLLNVHLNDERIIFHNSIPVYHLLVQDD